jgi:hypothetical protein
VGDCIPISGSCGGEELPVLAQSYARLIERYIFPLNTLFEALHVGSVLSCIAKQLCKAQLRGFLRIECLPHCRKQRADADAAKGRSRMKAMEVHAGYDILSTRVCVAQHRFYPGQTNTAVNKTGTWNRERAGVQSIIARRDNMASPPLEGDSNLSNTAGVTGTNSAASAGIGVLGTSVNGEGVHGQTQSTKFAAVAGIELNQASPVAAVFGQHNGNGPGVFGISTGGEGVHGETTANNAAAVGAVNKGNGTAVFGTSQGGEGVHGETQSTKFAAVAGIELNKASPVAAVFGQHTGAGPGLFGTSQLGEGVHGETNANNAAAVGAVNKGNGTAVFGISQGGEGVHGETSSDTFAGVAGINNGPATPDKNPTGVFGNSQNGEGVHGQTNSIAFAAVAGITLNPNATGAGIYGESRGQNPAGFFKGNVVVTGDILLSSADCAEEFDVAADEEAVPGTVMAIGPAGTLVPSEEAYDKKVVGIVSGAGDYKPAIILDRQTPRSGRATIALMGKVCVKVDARYGGVEPGDLLTSSPTPGHAMRASDPLRAVGSVIGKALGNLDSGQGLVAALVGLR